MAVTQTGSTLQFDVNDTANTGTVSSTITVPSDATKVLVAVNGFQGTAGGMTTATFTKGAADTAMTRVDGGDTEFAWANTLWWMDAPDTGTNKSLKWDWVGTGTSADGHFKWSITFWKDCDTGVRDSDGQHSSGTPHATATLTAQSGDLIVAFAGGFNDVANGSIDTWTNLSTLTQLSWSGADLGDGAWGTGSPSGNTSVGWTAATNITEGGVLAVVLKPAAAGAKRDFSWHFG